ncbi:MAG: hypothetical protein BGO54_00735 [Sphingobacteriales bacterium 46-32]|nr:MAG: hypothetical protein BGO54_00735 [Sphingobacteriales bacterium 46-32]
MDIVMIGSGNVAAVLGRKFVAAGHRIVQILSRNSTEASALAYEWDTESANYMSLINPSADVYLLAVSDKGLGEVAAQLNLPGKVVAHTAGAVAASVLADVTEHYGVLYPLQSLRKENLRLPEIPFYVDGHTAYAKAVLHQLASSVSSLPVTEATDAQRLPLHVAAVFVNNFVNHLYVLAQDYCIKNGIDFAQLTPLIRETAERISQLPPKQAQTGPAIRHDADTLRQHLQLLEAHPHLRHIYLLLTESIQQEG